VQFSKPFTERCERERAPGEIWPTAGMEVDNMLNTVIAIIANFESMQNQPAKRDRPEAGIGCELLIAGFSNRSILNRRAVTMSVFCKVF